jgi:hypothetical protein
VVEAIACRLLATRATSPSKTILFLVKGKGENKGTMSFPVEDDEGQEHHSTP